MGELLTKPAIEEFLTALESRLESPVRLYLVGESSLVVEGWRDWTDVLVYTTDPTDPHGLQKIVEQLSGELEIKLERESPADVVPLPEGYGERARPLQISGQASGVGASQLELYHFDPYSTAVRLIARGDEPDYQVVLVFLQQGWMELEEMDRLLADLLPRFTADTLQQDPAEFRRKYKGLRQMWLAHEKRPSQVELPSNGQSGLHAGF